jgi:hypothetical protein
VTISMPASDLLPDDVRYRLAYPSCEFFVVVWLTVFPESKKRDQGIGSGQASDVRR